MDFVDDLDSVYGNAVPKKEAKAKRFDVNPLEGARMG